MAEIYLKSPESQISKSQSALRLWPGL